MRKASLLCGFAALLTGAIATPGLAQQAAPACTAVVVPEGPLSAWASPVDLQARPDEASLAKAAVSPGQAVRLRLLPTPDVRYPLRPEKPGGSVSHGGLVAFDVAEVGNYLIALGSPAWIDVVANGQSVASTGHGHGPDCSGIRKMVDFALSPGHYIVQISANGEPQTELLVVRLP